MGWIYLAGSEVSLSPFRPGSNQLPIVRTMDTPQGFYCPECSMATYQWPLYGATCGLCGYPMFVKKSISFMAGSLARILVRRDLESAWEASEADFLTTSRGLSKKATRGSFFSKTSRQLELVASMVSRKHLPNWGMIVGGRLYQPPKLAPLTYGRDGSFLPTPTTKPNHNKRDPKKPKRGLGLAQAAILWPTPRAQMACGSGPSRTGHRLDLQTAVRWATPTVRDAQSLKKVMRGKGSKAKGNGFMDPLPVQVGGTLNPQWVEWLMGYKTGWTALEGWAMQWFLSKRGKRLKN